MVTVLLLGHNQIGVGGAKFIHEALKVNKSVAEISLDSNKIGDKGLNVSVKHWKWTRVTDIDLRNNNIGDAAAKSIAKH